MKKDISCSSVFDPFTLLFAFIVFDMDLCNVFFFLFFLMSHLLIKTSLWCCAGWKAERWSTLSHQDHPEQLL